MWGVPIDHEYFKNTNLVQWMWYYHNELMDRDEEFIKNRYLVEYHASFIEPGMVRTIIDKRNSGEDNVIGTTDDDAFSESVGQLFGRDVNLQPEIQEDREVHEVSDMLDRVNAYEKEQAVLSKENFPLNYQHWSEFDLE